jgi:DNA-binding response OmpR family regulator
MRVLVVEDEPDTAESINMLLRLSGYDVQVARDGPSGVSTALTMSPDIVLLDIGLPGMDGWNVARQLREMQFIRRPAIIVVSGYGQEADRKKSYKSGVDFHFLKPVDPAILLGILDRLCQHRGVSNSKPASLQ